MPKDAVPELCTSSVNSRAGPLQWLGSIHTPIQYSTILSSMRMRKSKKPVNYVVGCGRCQAITDHTTLSLLRRKLYRRSWYSTSYSSEPLRLHPDLGPGGCESGGNRGIVVEVKGTAVYGRPDGTCVAHGAPVGPLAQGAPVPDALATDAGGKGVRTVLEPVPTRDGGGMVVRADIERPPTTIAGGIGIRPAPVGVERPLPEPCACMRKGGSMLVAAPESRSTGVGCCVGVAAEASSGGSHLISPPSGMCCTTTRLLSTSACSLAHQQLCD